MPSFWPISGKIAWSDYLSCLPFNARAKMKFAPSSAYLLRKSHILYFIPISDTVLKKRLNKCFCNPKMGRLNEVQRHRALGMVEGGLPFREVGRRMGCSHQTIMKLVERNANTGQRVTSCQQDQHVYLTHLRDRFKTSVQTAQETLGIHNQRVSASTVRRRLRERDIGNVKAHRGNVLTLVRRRNRNDGCRQHLRWTQRHWQSVMFYRRGTVLHWYAQRTCKRLATLWWTLYRLLRQGVFSLRRWQRYGVGWDFVAL